MTGALYLMMVDIFLLNPIGYYFTLLGCQTSVQAYFFILSFLDEKSFKEADIARSLLLSISNDIGQIACLHARIHGLKKVYFGGYFIRGHPLTMHTITYAINFWSKVNMLIEIDLLLAHRLLYNRNMVML